MSKKSLSSRILAVFFAVFSIFLYLSLPALAQNATNTYGLDETAGKVDAYKSQTANPDNNFLNTRIGGLIGTILSFVGVIFLVLMVYGGLSWMTAGGNKDRVEKSKDLIINAVIGIAIVAAAYAITSFIGNNLL